MSLKSEKPSSEISVLILAAGSSSRLGRPKQLVEWKGKTLLENAIQSAQAVSVDVNVILGANAELIKPHIEHLNCSIWTFDNWEEGMGSTISFGVKKILKGKTPTSILLSVCDQPFLSTSILESLINSANQSTAVASKYGGSFGVPALFRESMFPSLLELHGDKGAKKLIQNSQPTFIPFPKGEIDIDSEEGLERLIN